MSCEVFTEEARLLTRLMGRANGVLQRNRIHSGKEFACIGEYLYSLDVPVTRHLDEYLKCRLRAIWPFPFLSSSLATMQLLFA